MLMTDITAEKLVAILKGSFYVSVSTNKHIISTHLFKDNFTVNLSVYGEINNHKKCISIEQLDKNKYSIHTVRLSLENLESIKNDGLGITEIAYDDGYKLCVFC